MEPACALYLAEVLTYGTSHPIKIGVSKHPFKRMGQLTQISIYFPKLLGFYLFPNRKVACWAETAAVRRFPRGIYAGTSREVLECTITELIEFLDQFQAPYISLDCP
jgi:hypothetical protein